MIRTGAIARQTSAAVLAFAVAASGAYIGSGIAHAAPVLHTYTALPPTTAVTNPERGFFHHTATHSMTAGSPGFKAYTPLSGTQLTNWRTAEGVTIVQRLWYLERYVATDTLDSDILSKVAADFATARASGVKLLVRFAYSETSSLDAPPARVEGHIAQLAPILNTYAGQIFAVQAGFVGKYGEWYYTDNYGSDPAHPWILTDADWAARGRVLNALLDKTAGAIPVQVRSPSIKQRLVPTPGSRALRVGIHDDCFVGNADDMGTFLADSDRAWLATQTKSVLMAGETCQRSPAPDQARSLWPNAKTELAAYHWTALNRDWNPLVLNDWGTAGLAETKARLGYRLRLVSASLPTTATAGGTMRFQMTFANNGFASLPHSHPVHLVLRNAAGTQTYKVKLPVNLGHVAAGGTTQYNFSVTAPATTGSYSMYLSVSDPTGPLAGDPKYNIAMANANMWTAEGWNRLNSTIQLTAAG